MAPEHVDILNKSIQYAVGYFEDSVILTNGHNIVLEKAGTTSKNGKVVFCNRIGLMQQASLTFAGFVYMVTELGKNKYYEIETGVSPDALKHPVPFKGGIAINLTNGYTYAVQPNGELRELMSPSVLKRLSSIEKRLQALDGIVATSENGEA